MSELHEILVGEGRRQGEREMQSIHLQGGWAGWHAIILPSHSHYHALLTAQKPASLLLIRICLILAYIWLLVGACNGYPSWPHITDGPAGQPGFISVDGIVW